MKVPEKQSDWRFSLFEEALPFKAKLFISAVVVTGSLIFLHSARICFAASDSRWLYLGILTALASFFSVKVPVVRNNGQSVTIAMGEIFVFAGILLFGPEIAACLAAIEAISISLKASVKHSYKLAFNVTHLVASCFLVGNLFYLVLGPIPLSPAQVEDPAKILILTGFLGLVYFSFNTGIVALGMALATGQPFPVLWHNLGWAAISHFSSASLGALLFLFFEASEFYFVVLATPMVVLVYYTYRINQARIRQTQRHLDEVSALLAEKIEAEKQLQKAKDELEIRVEQRTFELQRANQRLQVEVNERKTAQQALAAETERLSVTLRSLGDGVVTTDRSGKVVLINAAAEKMTGWTQQQAKERTFSDVLPIIKRSDESEAEDLARKVIESGEIIYPDGEDRAIVARDGSHRSISHSAAPIRDTSGRISGAVIVFRDISEKQRMEQELLKAQKLESLGILAGGIAHDFNNILAGILLKTQMAQRALSRGKDARKYLSTVQDAVQTATGLTRQLLTFAKGGDPVKQMTSVAKLLREAAEFALRGSRVSCEFHIADDLWCAEIDRGQISQVIHNLVINAAQAMPDGGTISVRAENVDVFADQASDAKLEPGRYVGVSVADEGVGIRPEDLGCIFDPYYSTKPTGHGLGLTTTHSIIKKHAGHIEVTSTVDQGSRFLFYLPAVEAEQPPLRSEVSEPAQGCGKILVMDDEVEFRETLIEVLEELGYVAVCASEGGEAVSLYRQAHQNRSPYDLVIMDLTVPGGRGGKEAVKKLLEIDPEAAVVVTSGYSKDPVLAAYEEYGFKANLPKPFDLNAVARVVATVLGQRPTPESVGPKSEKSLRMAG